MSAAAVVSSVQHGSALVASQASCHECGLLSPLPAHGAHADCPRCGAALHARKPRSLERTTALVIAAVLCYAPANLLPIMTVTTLGRVQSDTIMSGVVYFLLHGDWPLAVVIFTASIFVPIMKLMTEAIGRWSMVDIYVVTILVALVRLGNLATIEAEAGAVFFGSVVVLTMLAAESFDPRLIWDRCGVKNA
jgi:paraquat-inducible protein A